MATEVQRPDEVNQRLIELSKYVLPEGVELRYVPLDELREQDVNARSMPQKMFDQLVNNIAESGFLEGTPLCALQNGRIEIVSGHHRVRAARAAGLSHILCIVYLNLSRSRVRSKQLAHNTIAGKDDKQLMQRIWGEIEEINARFEAFVDPRMFDDLPKPVQFKPVDVNMQELGKTITILFLSTQAVDFDAAVKAILPETDLDTVYLAQREVYDGWRDAVQRVRAECNIVSLPTAIAEMARLACLYLDEHAPEAEDTEYIEAPAA